MLKMNESYLVSENGERTAVVLDIRRYRRLLRHLEDLEDALELDKAVRRAKSFRPHGEVREDLKKSGKL